MFGADDISEIGKAVVGTEFEQGFRKGSPVSLHAALRLVRSARQLDRLEDALHHEFRFTARSSERADLLEGIRAVLIDRDGKPNWMHATLDAVPDQLIDELLSPSSEADALFFGSDSATEIPA